MTAKKTRKNSGVATDWASPGSPEQLDELQLAAHGIVTERPDLRPSIARIIGSDLDQPGRLRALSLFKEALTTPGDPNRDPSVAITQSRGERTLEVAP